MRSNTDFFRFLLENVRRDSTLDEELGIIYVKFRDKGTEELVTEGGYLRFQGDYYRIDKKHRTFSFRGRYHSVVEALRVGYIPDSDSVREIYKLNLP